MLRFKIKVRAKQDTYTKLAKSNPNKKQQANNQSTTQDDEEQREERNDKHENKCIWEVNAKWGNYF